MGTIRNDAEEAVARARNFRKRMTATETAFWQRIRRQSLGYRFRRQYPARQYILDFYCPQLMLCVEIDGPMHALRTERDKTRDETLASLGIRTVRFSSEDAYYKLNEVVEKLASLCREREQELAARSAMAEL